MDRIARILIRLMCERFCHRNSYSLWGRATDCQDREKKVENMAFFWSNFCPEIALYRNACARHVEACADCMFQSCMYSSTPVYTKMKGCIYIWISLYYKTKMYSGERGRVQLSTCVGCLHYVCRCPPDNMRARIWQTKKITYKTEQGVYIDSSIVLPRFLPQ